MNTRLSLVSQDHPSVRLLPLDEYGLMNLVIDTLAILNQRRTVYPRHRDFKIWAGQTHHTIISMIDMRRDCSYEQRGYSSIEYSLRNHSYPVAYPLGDVDVHI